MEDLRQQLGRTPVQPFGEWEEEAKGLIEEEMMRRGIRYKELSRMLGKLGIDETPDQINRKVNRKRFSAAFLIGCLRAMGVEEIKLPRFEQEQKVED
jgi:hypothetical protein